VLDHLLNIITDWADNIIGNEHRPEILWKKRGGFQFSC